MGARLRRFKHRIVQLFRRERDGEETKSGTIRPAELLRVSLGVFVVIFVIYTLFLAARFGETDGDDLGYPQRVLGDASYVANPGAPLPASEAAPDAEGETCAPSWTVRTLIRILETLVEDNLWIPGDPQYKLGWFGLASFESGPFFDNEASFQLGALRSARRISVELVDLLGRARGTSGVDDDLAAARGALHWNERAWRVNPFEPDVPFLATPAAKSYRTAIERLRDYDRRLTACDALFDSRNDNLFLVFDRIANDIGSMTDTLATRSKGQRWSTKQHRMVEGEGNDRGIFDFRADDLFHVAHGQMWAYHGVLQALRLDFGATVEQNNLHQVWDRLERHVAETAALDPVIVSNGREDSVFQPDHLSIMSVNMLRARANLVELREVLNR
jgi:hypothetical protein